MDISLVILGLGSAAAVHLRVRSFMLRPDPASSSPVSESKSSAPKRAAYRLAFLRNWLKDPFHVAAIAPTGQSVARLMATGLRSGHRVVELGAGTGTITQAILDAGVHPADLYAVEVKVDFARILNSRFPTANIVQASAEGLLEVLGEQQGRIDYVISGLPILWFETASQRRILSAAFKLLRPSGSFHQFTYWGRPPVGNDLLLGLDLKTSRLGFSPWNLPPAFAFRFEKATVAAALNGAPQPVASHAPRFRELLAARKD